MNRFIPIALATALGNLLATAAWGAGNVEMGREILWPQRLSRRRWQTRIATAARRRQQACRHGTTEIHRGYTSLSPRSALSPVDAVLCRSHDHRDIADLAAYYASLQDPLLSAPGGQGGDQRRGQGSARQRHPGSALDATPVAHGRGKMRTPTHRSALRSHRRPVQIHRTRHEDGAHRLERHGNRMDRLYRKSREDLRPFQRPGTRTG